MKFNGILALLKGGIYMTKIVFVGAGAMAEAIINGLTKEQKFQLPLFMS